MALEPLGNSPLARKNIFQKRDMLSFVTKADLVSDLFQLWLRIRFACVDAPEIRQENGIASRDHLRSIIDRSNNQIAIKTVDVDGYYPYLGDTPVL